MGRRRPAILVLEDGRTFRGEAYGSVGETFGEAVFNTGMTGYQETLTDPSYHRQVVVQTAPHIGNTGVNPEDDESGRIWVAGYVVRDPARIGSNWRATGALEDRLATEGVVGIAGVDTRALTRHLRERGAMRVGVSSLTEDPDELLARVREAPRMEGADLSAEVTTPRPYVVQAEESTGSRSPRSTWGSSGTCRAGSPRAGSPRTCCRPRPASTTCWPPAPTRSSSRPARATRPPPTIRPGWPAR
ncbi:hypothetical protein GCM10027615_66480 [Plantactinospora veratri]